MNKLKLLLLLFLLIPSVCFPAEFLVRAKGHWKDTWTPAEVANLTVGELQEYNARTQKGDIVDVRPDGYLWGKCEGYPDFIVVKLPGISVETVKKYIDKLTEQYLDKNGKPDVRVLKIRKYSIPKTWVEDNQNAGQFTVELKTKTQRDALINSIIEKTQ